MEMYKMFGVHEDILNWWKSVHEIWKFRAGMTRGQMKAMRLTGQATTAIGNVFTNNQVHAQFYYNNLQLLKYAAKLGDDNISFFSENVNAHNLVKDLREKFNMECHF